MSQLIPASLMLSVPLLAGRPYTAPAQAQVPTPNQPEGKQWWAQLQHDRAVESGLAFEVYKPTCFKSKTSQPDYVDDYHLSVALLAAQNSGG